ncbi:MAG: hypothetical protein HY548_05710, partial [Elusimicrobia bacterium]|nr:hypothetical protein [Elusimicrobiota bacterium]
LTQSWSAQTYIVIFNQAKLKTTTSRSISQGIDGTTSVTEPYTTTYWYYGEPDFTPGSGERSKGLLAHAAITSAFKEGLWGVHDGKYRVKTLTTDEFGNKTYSFSNQEFAVVKGQAKLSRVENAGVTDSVDGSKSITDPYEMHYAYDEATGLLRAAGGLEGGLGPVNVRTVTEDAAGNTTDSTASQIYDVVANQAKVASVTSESTTLSIDGSVTFTDPYTIEYQYSNVGLLSGVTNEVYVHSASRDAFGNETETFSIQTYFVHAGTGQAKMAAVTTMSIATSIDGSRTETMPYTTVYEYNARNGKLENVYIQKEPVSLPELETRLAAQRQILLGALGVLPEDIIELKLDVDPTNPRNTRFVLTTKDNQTIEGALSFDPSEKVILTITRHDIPNNDGGTTQFSPYQKSYTYQNGVLQSVQFTNAYLYAALGGDAYPIHSITTDVFGNVTETWSDQKFVLIAGQAKMVETKTESRTTGVDGTTTTTDAYVTRYAYAGQDLFDSKGRLVPGKEAEYRRLVEDDRVGHLERAWIASTSAVDTVRVNGKTYQAAAVDGGYHIRSVSLDSFGNVTYSYTRQEFKVVAGQAKLVSAVNSSVSSSIDGTVSVTEPYETTYAYFGQECFDDQGRLKEEKKDFYRQLVLDRVLGRLEAVGSPTVKTVSVDVFENKTTTISLQVFKVHPGTGQAKLYETVTTSLTEGVDGTLTYTAPYRMINNYHENGLLKSVEVRKESDPQRYVEQLQGAVGREADLQRIIAAAPPSGLPRAIHTISLDVFGGVTQSWTDQTYEVIAGQSKLVSAVTESLSLGVDGTETRTHPYETVYHYVGQNYFKDGLLIEETKADYLENVAPKRHVGHLDYSNPPEVIRLSDAYEGVRFTNDVAVITLSSGEKVTLQGNYQILSESTDVFGNATYSVSRQTFKVLFNQAKLDEVTNASVSESIDGTRSVTDPYTTKYWYYGEEGYPATQGVNAGTGAFQRKGLLAHAEITSDDVQTQVRGHVVDGTYKVRTVSNDLFGNTTYSFSNQRFDVIVGQAKLREVDNASLTDSIDGSVTVTERYTIRYSYWGDAGYPPENNGDHRRGLLADAKVVGLNVEPITPPKQPPIPGPKPPKPKPGKPGDSIESAPGKIFPMPIEKKPRAKPPVGGEPTEEKRTDPWSGFPIRSKTVDAFGNVTESYSKQEFTILFGQAKLKRVESGSVSTSIDGTVSVTKPYVTTYFYWGEAGTKYETFTPDRQEGKLKGLLAGAVITSGNVTKDRVQGQTVDGTYKIRTESKDAFGNTTYNYSNQ